MSRADIEYTNFDPIFDAPNEDYPVFMQDGQLYTVNQYGALIKLTQEPTEDFGGTQ